MKEKVKILALGDVVAKPGREVVARLLPVLREKHDFDLVIANGENSAAGDGISPKCADELIAAGVDVITMGDHTWGRAEASLVYKDHKYNCIRPSNFPAGLDGRGVLIFETRDGIQIGVCNLIGRVFMNGVSTSAFDEVDRLLKGELSGIKIRVCDFHCEATSEKLIFGRYLDSQFSLVFGTHTHVQTSDERILPGGTAFITDLGMCGSQAGVIGMRSDIALKRVRYGVPARYEPAEGDEKLHGAWVEVDVETGRALKIERVALT